MDFNKTFADLSLPRNQDLELAPLLAPTLAEIWAEFSQLNPWTKDEMGPVPPLYPESARLEQVQVLGLNPSLNPHDRDKLTYPVGFDSHPYFRRIGRFGQQIARQYQRLFQESSYSPGEQLYHFGELEWGHLDLLYMRATSQRALETQVWNTPGAASFVWQQLQLTKRLLALLQPVALVVANRFGQRLTGFYKNAQTGENEWMGLQFTPEPDEFGAYRIIGSTTNRQLDPDGAFGLADTPVFFTSSFAGTSPRNAQADTTLIDQIAQICLQNGTRYFSQWHIK
ncbi:hypothetical protein GCM10027422_04020 [Hymenobacter arcticus]